MKTVLSYSGGLDSTVLLAKLHAGGHDVHALIVDYGQKHRREIASATAICRWMKVPHQIIDLTCLKPLMKGSSQTDDSVPVPEGHYADETMRATVVPNRNMILLSTAYAWAISLGAKNVAYAAHAGDHAIYPDCRPAFIDVMRMAGQICHYTPVALITPFNRMTKSEIVTLGAELKAPMDLSWSCYKGGELHCGKCGTCVERIEAFKLSSVVDPTKYEEEL